jgi:hypothetical protein
MVAFYPALEEDEVFQELARSTSGGEPANWHQLKLMGGLSGQYRPKVEYHSQESGGGVSADLTLSREWRVGLPRLPLVRRHIA